MLMEPSWGVLEFELASALHGVIKKYWNKQSVRRDMLFRPNPQVKFFGICFDACWKMHPLLHKVVDCDRPASTVQHPCMYSG